MATKKTTLEYSEDAFNKLEAYMRGTHEEMIKNIEVLKSKKVVKEVSKYNDHQKKVMDQFTKFSYGCQHTEVMHLVAAIEDIDYDDLYAISRGNRNVGTVALHDAVNGIFLKLTKKSGSHAGNIPEGSIIYVCKFKSTRSIDYSTVSTRLVLLPDTSTSTGLEEYKLTNKESLKWENNFRVATEDEISGFMNLLKGMITLGGKWNTTYSMFKKEVFKVEEPKA